MARRVRAGASLPKVVLVCQLDSRHHGTMKLCLRCQTKFDGYSWVCPACKFEPETLDGFFAFAPPLAHLNDGAPEGAHHNLDQLQSRSFWFRSRNRLIQDLVRRYFSDAADVLEIGCGSGFVMSGIRAALPAARLVASETYVHGLAYAARRISPPCELVQMDARAIPYSGEFDLVGAFDVLEHIDEDSAVIAEVARALRPGGRFLVTVPQHRWLWSKHDVASHHRRRYSTGELAGKLRRAGFELILKTSFVSFLLPLMLVQRLIGRQKADYSPQRQFLLPPLIDRSLELVLDLERKLIGAGLRLPLGGSQVIVARAPC
jgi:SAM-dependent methyltransferase